MDTGTLIATIIGAVIAGVFGLITKYLELRFEKKKDELPNNPPPKDADDDGNVTAIEEDNHSTEAAHTTKKKTKFSWIEQNFRKLSTAGFIVAGVVATGIIVMVTVPAIKNNGAPDSGDGIVVPAIESVTTPAEETVNIEDYADSIARIVTKDDIRSGNAFAVNYKNKLYFVTTFFALTEIYEDTDANDGFYLHFETQNDIYSKDLTLVGYSPLYNVAVLSPNIFPDIKGYELSETEASMLTDISVIGMELIGTTSKKIAKPGKIMLNDFYDNISQCNLYLSDAKLLHMDGAPAIADDLKTVIGMANGEMDDDKSFIIPASYIKTVLDEMSKPETTITSFPVDELPDKFVYFGSNNREGGATVLLTRKDGVVYQKGDDIDFMGEYIYAEDKEYYNGIRWLTDGETVSFMDFTTLVWLNQNIDDSGKESVEFIKVHDDLNPNYDLPYFCLTVEEDYAYIYDPDDGIISYVQLQETAGTVDYVQICDLNQTVFVCVTEKYIEYNEYSEDNKTVYFYPDETETDLSAFGGVMPENLTLKRNEDGYKLYLTDKNTGFSAYIDEDGTFMVSSSKNLYGGNNTSDGNVFIRRESEDGDTENDMLVTSSVTDSENYQFIVSNDKLSDQGRDYATIRVSENEIYRLALERDNCIVSWYSDKSTYCYNSDNDQMVYHKYYMDGIVMYDMDTLKAVYIDESHYVISMTDENGYLIGEPYPYLLDYNDIPDSTE
ncbi:MAG: hypothetical protein LBM41_05490 [Ruminococcus sp.]|jgi:hypothetical protein|nr:hypothetical protein [Ruminococcus sp.]